MSYIISINGNSIVQEAYTGMIMGYFGTIEPPGWVFADGVARSNNDGRYNALINALIGTSVGGYTPPNLKAAFLRGAGTNNGYTGPPVKTIYTPEMYSHSHTASQPSHTHVLNATYNSTNYSMSSSSTEITTGSSTSPSFGVFKKNSTSTPSGLDSFGTELGLNTTYGITINNASVTIGMQSTIVGALADNNESRPYNIGTAWIIKM
jgi:hypothetical protein